MQCVHHVFWPQHFNSCSIRSLRFRLMNFLKEKDELEYRMRLRFFSGRLFVRLERGFLWWCSTKKVWILSCKQRILFKWVKNKYTLTMDEQQIKRYNFRWLPSICFVHFENVCVICVWVWVCLICRIHGTQSLEPNERQKSNENMLSSVEIEFNLFWECIFSVTISNVSEQSENCHVFVTM